jgi:hypothetical protein
LPSAVTFAVNVYRKLSKEETGPTNIGTRRIPAAMALDFIFDEFPDDCVSIRCLDAPGGTPLPDDAPRTDYSAIYIDWTKVPDYLRNPAIPARRR